MKKTICDRCGKEIKGTFVIDPSDIRPHYHIAKTIYATAMHPFSNGREDIIIDLCPSCEKEFSDWLSNKEAQ
jgi:hypothetical protein